MLSQPALLASHEDGADGGAVGAVAEAHHIYLARHDKAVVGASRPTASSTRGECAAHPPDVWAKDAKLRGNFTPRLLLEASADHGRIAWLPHANVVSVIVLPRRRRGNSRRPPNDVVVRMARKIELYNEFVGDMGASFYWRLDYATSRQLVQYLRFLERTAICGTRSLRRRRRSSTPATTRGRSACAPRVIRDGRGRRRCCCSPHSP